MASVIDYRASKMLDMFVDRNNLHLDIKGDKFSVTMESGIEVSSGESTEFLKFLTFAITYQKAQEAGAQASQTLNEVLDEGKSETPVDTKSDSAGVALTVEAVEGTSTIVSADIECEPDPRTGDEVRAELGLDEESSPREDEEEDEGEPEEGDD